MTNFNHRKINMNSMIQFTKGMMLLSLVILISFSSLFGQGAHENDSSIFAQISMENEVHNFGDLNQGDKGVHVFEFRNSGNAPLILNNVLSTCGCTVPEWPKEPIPADSTGTIKVVFDSTSKIGRQNKVITIRSNSKNGDYRLRISAMVLPAKK